MIYDHGSASGLQDMQCPACKRSIVSRFGKKSTGKPKLCESCVDDKTRLHRRQDYRALNRRARILGLELQPEAPPPKPKRKARRKKAVDVVPSSDAIVSEE